MTVRVYTITFEQVAVAGPVDLVTLLLPTSAANFKQIKVRRCWISATDSTIPTSQMLALRQRWLPATVTLGSGGSTPTPSLIDQGDPASKCSAHTCDTSKATTSGTAVVIDENGCHAYNGFDSALQGRDPIPLSNNSTAQQAFVFELLSTPSGTLHLSGGLDFSEEG